MTTQTCFELERLRVTLFAISVRSLRIIAMLGAANRTEFGTVSRKQLEAEKIEGILMAPSRNPESPYQEITP